MCAQVLLALQRRSYSVAQQCALSVVPVRQRLKEPLIDITTDASITIARHAVALDGFEALVPSDAHVAALETSVLAAFTTT